MPNTLLFFVPCVVFLPMKKDIHPTVYKDARITCTTCGAVFLIPNTVQEQTTEACRLCHPAYTGKRQHEQKGGRVERFRKRQSAAKGK